MELSKTILQSLQDVGCLIDSYQGEDKLQDFIQDSLSLISFIVNIEDRLGTDIDVNTLSQNLYEKSMREIEDIICSCISTNG